MPLSSNKNNGFVYKPSSKRNVLHSSLTRKSINHDEFENVIKEVSGDLTQAYEVLNQFEHLYTLLKSCSNGGPDAKIELFTTTDAMWDDFKNLLKVINSVKIVYNESDFIKKTKVNSLYRQVGILKYVI